MKNIYFIIGISVSLLLLYLILYNLTNTIYVEGLRGGSSDHNYARSASSDIDKGKSLVGDKSSKKNKQKKGKTVFKWPSKKQVKVHHNHPALLYYNANGDIVPVAHGHESTDSNKVATTEDDLDGTFNFGIKVNNASTVKFKKNKKRYARPFHYSMPLPLNDNNKIIDITSNSKYLSPALWTSVSNSNAVGYLYPYNIVNRFNKNAKNVKDGYYYGYQVHNMLNNKKNTDSTFFKGKPHTHYRYKKYGTSKGVWNLEKKASSTQADETCTYNNYNPASKKNDTVMPLNDCIYSGKCEKIKGSNSPGKGTCNSFSDNIGYKGNKNSCESVADSEGNIVCSWKYKNKKCNKYEDTETNQDTCTSYNISSSDTDPSESDYKKAKSSCRSNPWCFWG